MLFLYVGMGPSIAQSNFMGKPGLVRIPKSSQNEVRDYVSLQVAHMPYAFGVNNFMNRKAEELLYSAQIQPLSWLAVSFVLTRPQDVPRIGIGDRHIDVQLFLLKQEQHGVNLSAVISPMVGSSFLDNNSVFVGKKFKVAKGLTMESTAGYGLKSVYRKPFKKLAALDSSYQWIRKADFGNYYLSGFFGGLQFSLYDMFYISAEHDSQYINLGASVLFFKKLSLQLNYLNLESPTGSVSYRIFLDKPRKIKLKYHEET